MGEEKEKEKASVSFYTHIVYILLSRLCLHRFHCNVYYNFFFFLQVYFIIPCID
ncbi:uncharacterized protein BX663DRAFT_495516 [Cokeromyces recurvatus]|uniref:uncharacterized protein n=1 Tax=Cokeromyces recurvatus TaxID=90255 RepID=UPI0022209AA9|nr:uncharacterized protein BX663DRAFT_495516 [Cokeromyces recurvatus]KAI7907323.1 hypothetical protein BX663DRAFT_495516 [Cokeromyces recurvatus]